MSFQISFIVTNLKEKQSESFASLILRTLALWEKFSIALRAGSSLKSDNMGRQFLESLQFSQNDP